VTFPPGAPATPGRAPLDGAAAAVIASARQRITGTRTFPPAPAKALTDEERAEALDTISKGGGCACCGGIHAAADHGCPRLASFRLDGDGKLTEGTYFPDGQWDPERVIFADPKGETDDGPHPA
jgi:hypothetical protein